MFKKIGQFLWLHKIISVISLVIILGGGYFGVSALTAPKAQTRYVLAAVAKGAVISTITGSGQVSASNQVDLKPKSSGQIVYLNMTAGQSVKSGALLAQIDATAALITLRNAQASLQNAQLSLQKLQEAADPLSILQAQDAITAAQNSKQNAQDSLNKAYEDSYNTVSSTFLDLPTIMTGLDSTLHGYTLNPGQTNVDYYADKIRLYDFAKAQQFKDAATGSYQTALTAYNKNFDDYKATSRMSSNDQLDALTSETYDTTKDIAQAVKDVNNLIQLYEDELTARNLNPESIANTQLANLNSYTGTANTHLSALLSIEQTITTSQQTIDSSTRDIAEKTQALAKLQAGTDPLDIQSAQLNVKQQQNAVLNAQQTLADYSVRAPFDGVLASVSAQKGDTVSSGTAVATLITQQKLAGVSLNEVDAAKVKVGQKVTLTFDAVSGLTISGEVAQIDTLGTVSQGVVTYNVKISFDTQDERIKPGMSVTANIIIDSRTDVLVVPNAAIKTNSQGSYVQMPGETVSLDTAEATTTGIVLTSPLKDQTVTTGLSNDSSTEIIDGLKEGDIIIVRTVSSTTKTATASQGTSILQSVGGASRGGFGGAGR